MGFFDKLANYNNPDSLGNRLRNKRFSFFEKKLEKISAPIHRILDIGGLQNFWTKRNFHTKKNIQITLLNLTEEKTDYPNFNSVKGDATDLSIYKDKEFDIVFSNSVIEHLFTKEKQVLMAKEVQRVGKYHFIQTPNKYFFIEPHYMLPLFQFLPRKLQLFILTKTPLSRGKKKPKQSAASSLDEIRLLSFNEMKELFPESKYYKEKFIGTVKSFTAHNLPE